MGLIKYLFAVLVIAISNSAAFAVTADKWQDKNKYETGFPIIPIVITAVCLGAIFLLVLKNPDRQNSAD